MLDPSLQKSDEESAKEPMPSGFSLMPRIQGADFLGRETQENQDIYISDLKKQRAESETRNQILPECIPFAKNTKKKHFCCDFHPWVADHFVTTPFGVV